MTVIVSTVSAKGGSGKTTLAALLLASSPGTVSVIDCDPSESLGRWLALTESEIPYLHCTSETSLELAVEALTTDYALIDTPPIFEAPALVQGVITASNYVLTPCIPSPLDVDRLATLAEVVPVSKWKVVINQLRKRTRSASQITPALIEAGYKVLATSLPLTERIRTLWGTSIPTTPEATAIWKEINNYV